jgi:hypothetical protein
MYVLFLLLALHLVMFSTVKGVAKVAKKLGFDYAEAVVRSGQENVHETCLNFGCFL